MTDDELNASVAIEVMEWEVGPQPGGSGLRVWPETPRHTGKPLDDWSPATDIADAFEVVDSTDDQWSIDRVLRKWVVRIGTADNLRVAAVNDSLPRAICEAALKAVRQKKTAEKI